ncbi:unnamed protein product [Caenorhabditis angaria]|uniref:Aquaporin n=1 Tax=Caenorhabditis angaria TaxID=860376 RepID=A0A9P1IGD6_9PELO|nr:unnamed protein product [Caenorhabditis angaria]
MYEIIQPYIPTGAFKDALIYYSTVILVCQLGRYICDKTLSKKSRFYILAIEFFGTLQVTTTVYENAVIDIYLGRKCFALTLFIMGILFAYYNRGAYCGPFMPIEQFYYNKISLSHFVQLLAAQFSAGYISYRFARTIWLQATIQSEPHINIVGIYEQCAFNHPYHIYLHLLFELVGSFTIRHVLTRSTSSTFSAFFMAMVFTGVVTFVGDQALDPLIATTLFYGCRGLDFQHFILVYWISPVIGWLLSAHIDSKAVQPKKSKKKTN